MESRTHGSRPRPSQGQPYRGPTLSRPRTGMLEAKAKDTTLKWSPKKKVSAPNLRKFFVKFWRSPKKKKEEVIALKSCKFSRIFKRSQGKKCFKIFFASSLAYVLQDEKPLFMTLAIFNKSKNSAVLEWRTGRFRRLAGFEAKDFKLCPRGLHLWYFFSELRTCSSIFASNIYSSIPSWKIITCLPCWNVINASWWFFAAKFDINRRWNQLNSNKINLTMTFSNVNFISCLLLGHFLDKTFS